MVYHGRYHDYEPGELIGAGIRGTVYTVSGHPDLAVKVYDPHVLETPGLQEELRSKLEAMLAIGLDPYLKGKLSIAWPVDILTDDSGELAGYVMPRLDRDGMVQKELFSLDSWDLVTAAAISLMQAVNHVHDSGVIIGDMHPGTFLVDEKGRIRLYGCDAFQITNEHGRVFRCHSDAGHLLPSELRERDLTDPEHTFTVASDRYMLACLIDRLLQSNRHRTKAHAVGRSPRMSKLVTPPNGPCFEGSFEVINSDGSRSIVILT